MKTLLLTFFLSVTAYAHCPLVYKKENVCVMLDQNRLYIYPHGKSHDGPYTDLKEAKIVSVFSDNKLMKVTKVARGIYLVEGKAVKEVEIGFVSGAEKINLKVRQE